MAKQNGKGRSYEIVWDGRVEVNCDSNMYHDGFVTVGFFSNPRQVRQVFRDLLKHGKAKVELLSDEEIY